MTNKERIEKAIETIINWGQFDGDHHKAWALDQTLRVLTGDRYEEVVKEAQAGEDGPETYPYWEGIAP